MKHEFSLASKLATLEVGDVIFLPDVHVLTGPTNLEKQVQDRIAKSKRLVGRKFYTARADVICHHQHVFVLKIERTD